MRAGLSHSYGRNLWTPCSCDLLRNQYESITCVWINCALDPSQSYGWKLWTPCSRDFQSNQYELTFLCYFLLKTLSVYLNLHSLDLSLWVDEVSRVSLEDCSSVNKTPNWGVVEIWHHFRVVGCHNEDQLILMGRHELIFNPGWVYSRVIYSI